MNETKIVEFQSLAMKSMEDMQNAVLELMKGQKEQDSKTNRIEKTVSDLKGKVEDQITLNSHEQRKAQKEVAKRVYALAEEEKVQQLCMAADGTIKDDQKKIRKVLFPKIHRDVKDTFAVASYKDIRRADYNEFLNFVRAWRPKLIQ